MDREKLLVLTAQIVTSNPGFNISEQIASVFGALEACASPNAQRAGVSAEPQKPTPAVSVRSSVKPGALISLIDGKPYKMLRRHLSRHGYTPESYREAFGLPASYPMVAADYAAKRRDLAITNGLGRKPKA